MASAPEAPTAAHSDKQAVDGPSSSIPTGLAAIAAQPAAPAGNGNGTGKKKSSLTAKLKGALFLTILIIVAALSTTVLRKPLLASADWLRSKGEAGYAVIGAAGFAFLMVSGSSHLFDLVCGFFCGPLPGFAVSLITKLVATAASYLIGRFLLRDYVMSTYVQEYVWLRAVDRVLQEKPWSSNFLLRLSIIPAAIKSYGLGALQAPALPFFLSAAICQAALSYVLTDLGAGMQDPSDLFKAESQSSKVLEIVAMAACIVVILAGAYYGKKTVDRLRAEEEGRRVEEELKAMGLGSEAAQLEMLLRQDGAAMAEAGLGGHPHGHGHHHHHHHKDGHHHHHHHHHGHHHQGKGEGQGEGEKNVQGA